MKPKFVKTVILFSAMLVLILDAKTAFAGAAEGIQLCIRVAIPSLFPFILLSLLLTSSLTGMKIPLLRPLRKILRISDTAASLLVVGLVGGYPVGAQCLATACKSRQLRVAEGNRLIAFCSNAGPAFLFGIGMLLFENIWLCFLAWGIQIFSSVAVGILTPGMHSESNTPLPAAQLSLSAALKRSLETMAMICGWVVLFRILLSVLSRWVLWLLPETARILVYGIFEISNGCCALPQILPLGLRFLLFTAFLSFGGLCVTLQTMSVLSGSGISIANYLEGKAMQTAISILLACLSQYFLAPSDRFMPPILLLLLCVTWILYTFLFSKNKAKSSSIPQPVGV